MSTWHEHAEATKAPGEMILRTITLVSGKLPALRTALAAASLTASSIVPGVRLTQDVWRDNTLQAIACQALGNNTTYSWLCMRNALWIYRTKSNELDQMHELWILTLMQHCSINGVIDSVRHLEAYVILIHDHFQCDCILNAGVRSGIRCRVVFSKTEWQDRAFKLALQPGNATTSPCR